MKDTGKSFFKVALGYGGILLDIVLVGLLFLAVYLFSYEATRPNNIARKALSAVSPSEVRAMAEPVVSTLNFALMPEDECYDYICDAFFSSAVMRSGGENGKELEYTLRYDGDSLGKVLLTPTHTHTHDGASLGKVLLTPDGTNLFGFQRYTARLDELDFSALCGEVRLSVPPYCTVTLNGEPMGEEFVVDDQTPYALLEEFYGGSDKLPIPYLWTYDTGRYLVKPELKILDASGEVMEGLDPEALDDAAFADNCGERDVEAIRELSEQFVNAYIAYASNINRNTSGNYFRLERMMVMGSEAQKRMRYAVAGLGWANSKSEVLQSVTLNHTMELGGGYYFCDLTYVHDTEGIKGVVTTEEHMKMIFVKKDDGTLLINAISNY